MPVADEKLLYENISFLTEKHFPAIYREEGQELVALARDYYKWMESDTGQSVYNARKMFEYRDVASTLQTMLVFFQKKFLADLPYNESTIAFVVRNILDLYRRKGTSDGIELFFRLFYNESVLVSYPAEQMLKVSDSSWNTGNYLQLYPNDNEFISGTGIVYTYADLIARNITGSVSQAKAAVNAINRVIINGILTPVVYIDNVRGTFNQFDEITVNIDGEIISFGTIYGSLFAIDVDEDFPGTTGNQLGDRFFVESENGAGGEVTVTGITDKATGEIEYTVTDGGWGYSIANTRLLVSNQIVFTPNDPQVFEIEESLVDQFGNTGIVIGQNDIAVFVRMAAGDAFTSSSTIDTVYRGANNFTLVVTQVSDKNESSPGDLFPDTGLTTDVKVETLSREETINVILDVINPYTGVLLNAADYGAGTPMSGTASPVTINTVLQDAFDLSGITIGSIDRFENLNPGTDYTNDVFAIAKDDVISNLTRHNQQLLFSDPGEAGSFDIGEIITEQGTGIEGIVRATDSSLGFITVTPFSYYGFTGSNILKAGGDQFTILSVSNDYNSSVSGNNAEITTLTSFATGRITQVSVYNSGFGYIDGAEATLVETIGGDAAAKGTIDATKMGKTSGYWSSFSSHLNGYTKTVVEDGVDEYFDSKQLIQDSDFYQEYSYVIKSKLDPSRYTDLLRENVHLAGTKPFGQFLLRSKTGIAGGITQDFVRFFNDDGQGSPFDTQPLNEITSDILNFTVDSTVLTSDNEPSP
jgi:hypothetical protein